MECITQIQTVTVPVWAAPRRSLQRGNVKWILDLLCLQQVTYCCAALSAALEKPFKQDNLSASRQCSALFPCARTKPWDKGAVWLGIWSNWCGTMKGYFLQSQLFVTGPLDSGTTTLIQKKEQQELTNQIHPTFLIPYIFCRWSVYLSLHCLLYVSFVPRFAPLCHFPWKQLLLFMKPVDVLDVRCDM